MSTGIGCDFCLSEQEYLVYEVAPDGPPTAAASTPVAAPSLGGPWTACQRCAALIAAGKWRALLRRMRYGTAERRTTLDGAWLLVAASDGLGLAAGLHPALEVVCTQVLQYFRQHRLPTVRSATPGDRR